ncbi:MAG: NAD(P)-binding protein [Lachnospiraceae bacterium]|nr:NAD(P)-binding protein [Lachnospiraceae bacterium]MDD3614927.1 NAD(P)-binding protein [Lachnospiraceae bacterium]
MSRLRIITQNQAQKTVENLYEQLEQRITASPPGLCPVDMAASFLKISHAQSCGKCVPCRIGLGQLQCMMEDILDGRGTEDTLDLLEKTASAIFYSADCAIGYEAARMVLEGMAGFRDDYESHIQKGRCICELNQPVPCVSQCPAGVDVPGYIALVGAKRYEDAVRLIRKDNPMPAVCGLICEHPCENRCRRNMMDSSVNIRGLKRFAVEHAGEVPVPKPAEATGRKIAVIGGGPGGVSAAYYLALMGHSVTIFEQRKQLGGMLRYGIPSYRLPREVLDEELKVLLSVGIEVKYSSKIGQDIKINELEDEYDAVYIAIGAQTDRKVEMEGENAPNVVSAVELLRRIGDETYPDFTGKRIAVIGGGNVAMDVARSSIRFGASEVAVLYRRRRVDMTAQKEEVDGAEAEGCEIMDLMAPVKIALDEDGLANGVWVKPQITGRIKEGRPIPCPSMQQEMMIPCDLVIVAIGQGIESKDFEAHGIPVKRGGAIEALDMSGVKNLPSFFAGGDCVTGPATVIRAIAAGKVAAANIDEFLGYHHIIRTEVEVPQARIANRPTCGRITMKERINTQRVKDFKLIEIGMTQEEAQQESSRCLRCDHFGFGVLKGGRSKKW